MIDLNLEQYRPLLLAALTTFNRTEISRFMASMVLAAADGDDDGAIHGDDVNRAFRAAFVGVVARWSSRCRVVVGEVPGRRRHGGAGLRTCEGAA